MSDQGEPKVCAESGVVRVSPLTHERLECAVALFHAQLSEHSIPADTTSIRNVLNQYLEDPRHGFVLMAKRTDEGLLGVALGCAFLGVEHGGPSGWLDELYVRPQARGQGVGTMLLSEVIREATRRRWAALDLEVEADHRQVIPLYERHGFRPKTRSRYCLSLSLS